MNSRKMLVQERITNTSNLGLIPADELQLNIDVVYNSILDQICSVVPIDSPRQVISALKLVYGSPKKSVFNNLNQDVVGKDFISSVGSAPLDEYGYPTNEVKFNILTSTEDYIVCPYQMIIPGTVKIGDAITDDGLGSLSDGGSVDYIKGLIKTTATGLVQYKFDNYDIENGRNFVQFQKIFVETFADMYQLDLDSAVVLDKFKGVNLKENIENILPQALSQQIDSNILDKYFRLAFSRKNIPEFDAKVDWSVNRTVPISLLYEDLGTYVKQHSAIFAEKTGVVPNIILCDPTAFSVLSNSMDISYSEILKIYSEDKNNDTKYAGMPCFVGYLGNSKVFLVNRNKYNATTGEVVLTYKGDSDAQTAGVYTPFIPVTLRTAKGAEGNGMITTHNIYSISGFNFVNPELVYGLKIKNVNT